MKYKAKLKKYFGLNRRKNEIKKDTKKRKEYQNKKT